MHEMSLAESVLQIIEESARTRGFRRVHTVVLEIGALAAVEPDAMRFCFDAVTRGSIAEGAGFEVVHVPGTGHCIECGRDTELTAVYDACSHCGALPVQVTGGTEMRVKELEVD